MSTPGPPQNRLRPKATDGTLEFWWQPPVSDGGSPITGYTIEIPGVYVDTTPAEARYYKITGLTNGTTYTAQLNAINANGAGQLVYFRSVQPGNLPGPTQSQSFTRNGNGDATFEWTAPASDGGATIGWNVVTCYPLDSSGAVINRNVLGYETSLRIPDLSANTTYTALIRARNDPGYSSKGVYLAPVTFGTLPSDISGLTLWLDAADFTTLFSDASGLVLSTIESSSIRRWNDKSVGEHIFLAGAPATLLRDTYPTIQMTSTSSFTSTESFSITDTNTATVFLVGKVGDLATTNQQFASGAFGALAFSYNSAKGGEFSLLLDGGTALSASSQQVLVMTSSDTSNTLNIKYNPTYQTETSARFGQTLNTSTSFILGQDASDMRISELLIWNRVLSELERNTIVAYLQNKWGLSLFLPNPIVYLVAADLGDGSTTWTDRSGNGWNATLADGSSTKNGSNALVLDGSSYWTFGDIGLQTNFSMSVWFKRTAAIGSGGSIVTEAYTGGNYVNMAIYGGTYGATDTQFVGGFFDSGGWEVGAPQEFALNSWVQMTTTWDGSDIKTYINGTLVDTTNYSGLSTGSTGLGYRIGRRWDNADYVTGDLGEIRIDSVALTDAQVATYYSMTSPYYPSLWTERTASGQRVWTSITASSDGTKLAAVVYNGYIYTSTDSGATWTEQTAAGQRPWLSIASSSDGTKLVAGGSNEYIYTSTDSGANWTEQTASGQRVWGGVASSSDGTKLTAVAYNGYIYTSTDSGDTWTEQTASGQRVWTSVASSSNGTKLVAGIYGGGYIYTSTDSGATWTEQTDAGSRSWLSIASSSDGTKLAAVDYTPGYIYTSTDSGATWTEQTASGQRAWYSITSSADGTKLAAVDYNTGYIYISTDSGSTWAQQSDAGQRIWRCIASSSNGAKLSAGGENINIWSYAI